MNTKIIYAYDIQSYGLILFEPKQALLLAMFLTDDVGCSAQSFIPDFEDDEDHSAAMNGTQYSKIDGEVIITPEWVIDEDISIAKGNYFKIKAYLLAELLHQWDVVYKQKPLYISITIDNEHVQVIGSQKLQNDKYHE